MIGARGHIAFAQAALTAAGFGGLSCRAVAEAA